VAGALGIFHGMYFALFIRSSEYRAAYVLGGVALTELLIVILLWLITRKITWAHCYAAMILIAERISPTRMVVVTSV